MEIKPAWLLEGQQFHSSLNIQLKYITVAPHYFKPADLEQLATGDKKMPKGEALSSAARPS